MEEPDVTAVRGGVPWDEAADRLFNGLRGGSAT